MSLADRESLAALLDRCQEASVDIVVLEVKPVSGYVLYSSSVAPRMLEWKGARQDPVYDPLLAACEEAHKRGLYLFAGVNLFAEGHRGIPGLVEPHGTVFDFSDRRDWQCIEYLAPRGADHAMLVPAMESAGSEAEAAVFVSPANPDAVWYELAVLREVCTYPIDGVVLDRARFSGLESDFSAWARRSFEAFLGRTVVRWPEDVYEIRAGGESGLEALETSGKESAGGRVSLGQSVAQPSAGEDLPAAGRSAGEPRNWSESSVRVPGPFYDRWLVWRAWVIREEILKARSAVREVNPDLVFAETAGGWYPTSYREGTNWASPEYDPSRDYAWSPPDYQSTAHGHLLDCLYSGWYYGALTEAEAVESGRMGWASVEGAARLTRRVSSEAVSVQGGLYVYTYRDDPARFRQAMRTAYDLADGLWLLDAHFLDEYEWWEELRMAFPERFQSGPED